ncbi:MAG TPA: hypothetical protein VNN10_14580 [Dehalococcoidia bacterium]|nr:hypothetical protein [Dehalococcoidia bacterium]
MTLRRSAFDALLALLAALAWSFAVFAFGARWLSPLAGGLLALAVALSTSAAVLTMHLRDRRLLALSEGRCPSCGNAIAFEHRHSRWQPEARRWEAAASNWDCAFCGYSHTESWACPRCPRP